MAILTALASILILTGIFRAWNSIFSFRICPICAGVSGTWLWMLAAFFLGYGGGIIDPFVITLLMGGSVVGIAYKADKHVPERLDLLWKTIFIPLGFAAAYELLYLRLAYLIPLILLLSVVYWFFVLHKPEDPRKESSKVQEIKKGLEKCC